MRTILILTTLLFSLSLAAQTYTSKNGTAYFISRTDVINIDATNNSVASIVKKESGEIVAIVLIKAFKFTLATAFDHFNEEYMESSKYPKASYKGKILELPALDLSKDGTYEVTTEGELTIHGVTKPIKEKGVLTIKGGKLMGECDFTVLLDDYKIEVPAMVKDRVSQKIEVKLTSSYDLTK
ncbi:MAG: YceI family protein [Bacteroidales bacterium]|nr:YceI family protein [Bacteroidales bacterium]